MREGQIVDINGKRDVRHSVQRLSSEFDVEIDDRRRLSNKSQTLVRIDIFVL